MRLTEIEFIKDTTNEDGETVRSAGSRLRVDAASATSFVDDLKVAKRVVAEANAPVKAAPKRPADAE